MFIIGAETKKQEINMMFMCSMFTFIDFIDDDHNPEFYNMIEWKVKRLPLCLLK